ncbi:unnamed protein product [Boreogadus saida]
MQMSSAWCFGCHGDCDVAAIAPSGEQNPQNHRTNTVTLFRKYLLKDRVPHQMSALAFYRYEQPIVDYCQAHQPLRLNMGYEGPPQGLEELGPRDRGGPIQTVTLPPAVPSATIVGGPGPRATPPLRPPSEGPGVGPFPPSANERSGTLTFGR